MKACTAMLLVFLTLHTASSCIRTPEYYRSLKSNSYTFKKSRHSRPGLNKGVYKTLTIREDGACVITEIINSRVHRGGGNCKPTERNNVYEVFLSSNSFLTSYRLYVRINASDSTFEISDSGEFFPD